MVRILLVVRLEKADVTAGHNAWRDTWPHDFVAGEERSGPSPHLALVAKIR